MNIDSLDFHSISFALDMMARHKLFPKGEEEVWVDVTGYEGLYKISSYGRLMSFHSDENTVLTPDVAAGYWRYALSNRRIKRMTAHRLVAIHFIENPNKKPCEVCRGVKRRSSTGGFKWKFVNQK